MKKSIKILSFLMVVLMALTCTAASGFASESENISNDFITEKNSDIIRISPSYPRIGEPMKIVVSGSESEEFIYRWYVNDVRINNSADTYTPVEDDLEKMVTVRVYDTDAHFVGVKNIFISKVPVVYIETDDREPIVIKDKKLKGQMDVQGNDEFNSKDVLYSGEIEIKGRGNSTWKYDKKPYKIKLDSKTNLFGMGKNKHWVLLSNPVDTSGLRNSISYQLSGKMGLNYQDGTWVELILNGKDVGLYYLAEHIRVDSTRTDITDWESVAEDAAKAIYKKNKDVISKDQSEELIDLMTEDLSWTTSDTFTYNGVEYTVSDYYDVPDIDGGYLLELTNLAAEPKFTTDRNVSVEVNTPETVSADMKDYIASYVQAFEDALYSDDFCTEYNGRRMRYTEFIDVDSFAKGVILNELFQNVDFACRSTYFYKDVNGRLVYGPLWDMDMCFNYNADSWLSNDRTWIERLYQDPVFMKTMRDVYWEYRYTDMEDMLKEGGDIDTAYNKIYEAAVHNDKIWNSEVGFKENTADYKFRLQDKLNWLDSTLATLESSHSFSQKSACEDIALSFKDNILSIEAEGIEPTRFSVYVNGEFSQRITDLSDLNNISVIASDDDIISVVAYSGNTPLGGNYVCNQNYITALKVLSEPSKTTYSTWESIDLSGLRLEATYRDGTTAAVSPESVYTKVTDSLDVQLFCYNKVTDKCGSVELVLACGSQSVSIPLTVKPREDYKLVEQYINRIPTDTESTEFVKLTAEAWEQYEALSESARAQVSNYQILSDAVNILESDGANIIDCYHSSATRDYARNNFIIAVKASPSSVTFSYGDDGTKTTFKKNSIPQRLVSLKKLGGVEFWTVRRGLIAEQPTFEISVKYSGGAVYEEKFSSDRLFDPTENISEVSYPACIFAGEDFNITFNCSDDVSKIKLAEDGEILAETDDFSDGIICRFDTEGNHNVTLYYMSGGRWFEYNSFDIFAREPVDTTHKTKLDHTYTAAVTEPTCTEKGYTTYTCECGDIYVDDYIDAKGHSFGEWVVTTPATCTEDGEKTRYCSECDAFETEVIDAAGHTYVPVVTPPTCTEEGYTTYICSCGDSYVDDFVSAKGHSFGAWKITTPATCTEKGVETRYCSRCDETETRKTDLAPHSFKAVITEPTCTESGYTTYTCSCGESYVDGYVKALGHGFGAWKVTTPATCTEKGVETRYCSRCDETETRPVAKHPHSYKDTVTKPTCTAEGYTTHTCSCGDSYVDSYVEALGHGFGAWKVTTAPTCTEDGVETRYCSHCDKTETRAVAKLGHSYVDTITKPTCTAEGYTTHTCSCGDSYVDSYVEALGHSFGAWKITTAPTCTEDGVETRYCSHCDKTETRAAAKLGHSYVDTVTKPTCTAEGYTTHTCSCGDSYVDSYTEAIGHSYGEWSVASAATCTQDGVEARYCIHCGNKETRYIAKTGHSYTHEVVSPTCIDMGYTIHTCSCGKSYKDTYVNSIGHTYGEWQTVTPATCTSDGSEIRYCVRCDKSETRTVAATGHIYGEWQVTTPATCTKEGVETRYCTGCDRTDTRAIPKTEHVYTSVVTYPTCIEMGYTTHTCSCGRSYKNTFVNALGHSYGAWTVTTPATCTKDGVETRYCSRCDRTETRAISKLGHSYTDKITNSTCTEKGYTTHTCSCGESYVDSYVNALGHSYGAWTVTTPATCTKDGVETRYCSRCDKTETRVIAKLGHSYTDKITNPTCTEKGYTTHTCSCGESYVDSYVNALGHSYGAWTVVSEPTCTEDGVEAKYCSHCGKQELRYTSKTGHSYTHKVVKPTCTEQGYTVHTCHCGDTYKDTYVNALGHTYGEWKVTNPATCTKDGVETRYCTVCDKAETRKINAIGHSYGEWKVTTAATCTEDGVETRYCTHCDRTDTRAIPKTGHSYTSVVTAPTCTAEGYTTHTCHCGDSYVDSFVKAKGHTDGEWKITKPATFTASGEKTLYCKECGAIIRTETVPKREGRVVSVSINNVDVKYKTGATIKPEIKTEGGIGYTVKYESSNAKVATVDANGNITTHSKGTAKITCTVTDEAGNTVKDTRTLNVKFSFGQWLIWIFLFGFMWY